MNETITPHEVIEITDIDQQISNALIRQNVTDKVIAELNEKYGSLRLQSIDDMQTYLEIKAARKEVGKVRIIAEKICRLGREDAIKTQRLWLSKEKEVVAKIAEVENPLQDEIDRFDAEVERKALEVKRKRDEEFAGRQRELMKLGAQFVDGYYTLNHFSYEEQTIRDADSEIWQEIILPKYVSEFTRVENIRLFEEKRRADEIERLRSERERFDKEQADFRREQQEFKKQQDDAVRERRLAAEARHDEETRAERLAETQEKAKADALKEIEFKKIKEQEELAAAGDKIKWLTIVSQLDAVKLYEMKSPTYRRKLQILKEKFEEIKEL